jgi:DNA-binding NarL/FixJ family response regulator
MTRVLVVDDHPVFRDGLAAVLRSLPDIELVGLAADAESAITAAAEGGVDVVLMDLNLPGISGVEATEQIVALPEPPAVLVITMVEDDDTLVAALRAGARGYLLKGAGGDEVVDAVRTVAAGGAVFGPGVAERVLTFSAATPGSGQQPADGLTGREQEVLDLIGQGASNAQIARRLDLSVKTVQNYVSRILEKLQLADRTQAALHASRGGRSTSTY